MFCPPRISHALPKVVPRESLPVQAIARLEFGEHLLSVLGLGDTVELQVAKNLPPALLAGSTGSGDGGGINANAFRNSYLWQVDKGVLHVHGKSPLVMHSRSWRDRSSRGVWVQDTETLIH